MQCRLAPSSMRRCGRSRKRRIRTAHVPSAISNGDLTAEILSRLPARSVIRFGSVCKAWLSLISDPNFLRSHTRRNPHLSRRVVGLYLHHCLELSTDPRNGCQAFPFDEDERGGIPFHIPPLPLPRYSSIFNWEGPEAFIDFRRPCNGLFLCQAPRQRGIRTKYYVYNPTTRAVAVIPLPDVPRRCGGLISTISLCAGEMQLVFDPVRFPDRYRLFYKYLTAVDRFGISVYSSDSRSWTHCSPEEGFKIVDTAACCSPGVYWNGALNYLGRSYFVWFSVESDLIDEPKYMPNPRESPRWSRQSFQESGGRLYHMDTVEPRDRSPFAVWEMKQDYSGWSLLYNVDLSSVRDLYPKPSPPPPPYNDTVFDVTPLFILPESAHNPDSSTSRDGHVLVLSIYGKIVFYNPRRSTPEKAYPVLCFHPSSGYFDPSYCTALPFVYTLFPP